MYAKWVQKSMDFEVEISEKSMKKGLKNMTFFLHGFFINLRVEQLGFGEALGGLGRLLGLPKRAPEGKIKNFNKNWILKGRTIRFGEGFGRLQA